jgi:pSer/pThr/pTyr-binding forkhead associated (FHA) protein
MPVIQVSDKQYTLKQGQTRIGAGPDVDVPVSDDASMGVQAILELTGETQVIIRRARDGATVRVNGVGLGVEPTPLMHGDKIDVAGKELLFSEDKKVGATAFVSAADVAAIAAKRSGPARATANTGGRLVSLVDGKEYPIPQNGVVFGREAGSDIVVAQPEVSRRHASIAPTESGYVLQDLSTNGVWVNGNRVQGPQVLARSDVVRVGTEEFRFYADIAAVPKSAPTPASVPATPTPAKPVAAAAQQAAPPASREPPTVPASREPQKAPPAMTPAARSAPTPPIGSERQAEATAPVPHMPSPAPAPKVEPPTVPAAVGGAPRKEPASAPAAAKPSPRPRKEPVTATKQEPRAGVPAWLWLIILVIVAAAAYFLGKGSLPF